MTRKLFSFIRGKSQICSEMDETPLKNNLMYYCYKNNKTKQLKQLQNNLKNNNNWYEM